MRLLLISKLNNPHKIIMFHDGDQTRVGCGLTVKAAVMVEDSKTLVLRRRLGKKTRRMNENVSGRWMVEEAAWRMIDRIILTQEVIYSDVQGDGRRRRP